MIGIQIGLCYAIIHIVCVIHMFDVFECANYVADKWDRIIVWLFAPLIIIITLIRTIERK